MADRTSRRHVVVVGGGIAGLAAAWELSRSPDPPVVTVLEGSARCGGKLALGEIAGTSIDEGAEQVLLRRPEAVRLLDELGCTAQVIHPATSAAGVLVGSRLRPLPPRTLLGVPADLAALRRSGVVSPWGAARAGLEPWLPGRAPVDDVAVGPYLRSRLGGAVVDRLVEPLLGGVYAGHADRLSLAATMPQLWTALPRNRSVVRAARSVLPRPGAVATPVFGSLPGGLATMVAALLGALDAAGVQVRTQTVARELDRRPTGWRVVVGPTRSPEAVEADAVVVAVPGRPAARLLASAGLATGAPVARLAALAYASVGLVTLAFDALALRGSGFLVPPIEGRAVKAATFTSVKWARPGPAVVRLSYGRHDEEAVLQHEDADLVRRAVSDLGQITGAAGRLLDARVTRWGGGLPQYAPGHLDLVRDLRAAVATVPGLAVCGAAYDGVGVPACIGSGREAARTVLAAAGGLG